MAPWIVQPLHFQVTGLITAIVTFILLLVSVVLKSWIVAAQPIENVVSLDISYGLWQYCAEQATPLLDLTGRRTITDLAFIGDTLCKGTDGLLDVKIPVCIAMAVIIATISLSATSICDSVHITKRFGLNITCMATSCITAAFAMASVVVWSYHHTSGRLQAVLGLSLERNGTATEITTLTIGTHVNGHYGLAFYLACGTIAVALVDAVFFLLAARSMTAGKKSNENGYELDNLTNEQQPS